MDINLNIENVSQVETLLGMINAQINSLNSAMSSVSGEIGSSGITLSSASLLNVDLDSNLSGLSLSELEARIRDIRIKLVELDENMSDVFSKSDEIDLDDYGNFGMLGNGGNVMGMIYDQYDPIYGSIRYSNDYLTTNGCGFFSLLSVITAKTGYVFSYEEIKNNAEWVQENAVGKTNEERMEKLAEHLSEQFGYKFYKDSSNLLISSLETGNIGAIGLTSSDQSASGHLIPITGIMENGNIVVNDTDRYKYSSGDYKKMAHETGFNLDEFDLKAKQFSGGPEEGMYWYLDFGDNTSYYTDGIDKLNDALESIDIDD